MSAPTRAGRALRRSLLSGCVVVVVVAGYSGKRFIYERAHELGIRCGALSPHPKATSAAVACTSCLVMCSIEESGKSGWRVVKGRTSRVCLPCERRIVIIDGPDSWAKELVAEGKAAKFYGMDFTDESTIFERCLAKVKQAEQVRHSTAPHSPLLRRKRPPTCVHRHTVPIWCCRMLQPCGWHRAPALIAQGRQKCLHGPGNSLHQPTSPCCCMSCHRRTPVLGRIRCACVSCLGCMSVLKCMRVVHTMCSTLSHKSDGARRRSLRHSTCAPPPDSAAPWRGCAQELGQVDGICSFWEAAQALVASLAERVGLLAHPPAAVEAAREKQVRLWGLQPRHGPGVHSLFWLLWHVHTHTSDRSVWSSWELTKSARRVHVTAWGWGPNVIVCRHRGVQDRAARRRFVLRLLAGEGGK